MFLIMLVLLPTEFLPSHESSVHAHVSQWMRLRRAWKYGSAGRPWYQLPMMILRRRLPCFRDGAIRDGRCQQCRHYSQWEASIMCLTLRRAQRAVDVGEIMTG